MTDDLKNDDSVVTETQHGHEVLAAINFAASTFWQASNWRETLGVVLERLGTASRVNRAYVFENGFRDHDGSILTSQIAEWVAPGTAPQIDNESLQNASLFDLGLQRWQELLLQNRPVYGQVSGFPESEREILQSQDILSIAVVPVFSGKHLWGFIGFDDCARSREWAPAELDALSAAATTLGVAIDRQKLEDQLRFAQKMEAIGSLASGVAHDFNNMIQAILAFTSLAQTSLEEDNPVQEYLGEVISATERAQGMTQQLLRFAVKHETDNQEIVLVDLCNNVLKLLAPKLPGSISVTSEFADPSPSVTADFALLNQAVLNICLNARDAMPNGGELKISCRQLNLLSSEVQLSGERRSGEFALVTVEDTGCGIREENKERIFEPFFTTKRPGSGTGLGLSSAYGAIKQSRGFVEVVSTEGQGTKILVYLPVSRTGLDSTT